MVRIPYIKIPSVRVGSVGPTSNIGTGGATPAPPTPVTYLTQWQIVGNSEVHGNEIWSCGEYNPIDGKWHILVQPLGGSIADIALTEPLRMVNDVADTIEFPSDTEGKALVTRCLCYIADLGAYNYVAGNTHQSTELKCMRLNSRLSLCKPETINGLCAIYNNGSTYGRQKSWSISSGSYLNFYDPDYNTIDSPTAFKAYIRGYSFIYELNTPTTEIIDAPQIEKADSYSMVIRQGAKSVSWSSFTTNSE